MPDSVKATLDLVGTAHSGMLDALLESAPVAILVLDLDKNVIVWNPAAERIFGWTSEELIGKPYPLVPPGEWPQFEVFFESVIGGVGFTGVEAIRTSKTGKELHISISTAPMRGSDGSVVGAMAILEDITARRQLEEQVQHAQRMEAVGRLAGGIAHDFNNALTLILNYCHLLRQNATPEQLREVKAVERAANAAAELTGQLLAFSRRQVLQSRAIDLSHAVEDVVDMLQRLIGEDIRISTGLPDGLGPVRADPMQVQRMLMNLAVNARDAMPDGGELELVTRPGREGFVELIVRDTGEGMDEQTMAHAFDPFFTTKGPGKGTGLGLASVYGIVRQSGGDVEIDSAPGQGTVFRIQLPIADDEVVYDPPSAPPMDAEERWATVLVVEDHDDVRDVVQTLLVAAGYRVVTASSGEEALTKLSDAVDLILTDVVMGGMNGRQLVERVKHVQPGIRVLYMSGYTDDALLQRGIDEGAAFIHKPFRARELLDAVGALLEN